MGVQQATANQTTTTTSVFGVKTKTSNDVAKPAYADWPSMWIARADESSSAPYNVRTALTNRARFPGNFPMVTESISAMTKKPSLFQGDVASALHFWQFAYNQIITMNTQHGQQQYAQAYQLELIQSTQYLIERAILLNGKTFWQWVTDSWTTALRTNGNPFQVLQRQWDSVQYDRNNYFQSYADTRGICLKYNYDVCPNPQKCKHRHRCIYCNVQHAHHATHPFKTCKATPFQLKLAPKSKKPKRPKTPNKPRKDKPKPKREVVIRK